MSLFRIKDKSSTHGPSPVSEQLGDRNHDTRLLHAFSEFRSLIYGDQHYIIELVNYLLEKRGFNRINCVLDNLYYTSLNDDELRRIITKVLKRITKYLVKKKYVPLLIKLYEWFYDENSSIVKTEAFQKHVKELFNFAEAVKLLTVLMIIAEESINFVEYYMWRLGEIDASKAFTFFTRMFRELDDRMPVYSYTLVLDGKLYDLNVNKNRRYGINIYVLPYIYDSSVEKEAKTVIHELENDFGKFITGEAVELVSRLLEEKRSDDAVFGAVYESITSFAESVTKNLYRRYNFFNYFSLNVPKTLLRTRFYSYVGLEKSKYHTLSEFIYLVLDGLFKTIVHCYRDILNSEPARKSITYRELSKIFFRKLVDETISFTSHLFAYLSCKVLESKFRVDFDEFIENRSPVGERVIDCFIISGGSMFSHIQDIFSYIKLREEFKYRFTGRDEKYIHFSLPGSLDDLYHIYVSKNEMIFAVNLKKSKWATEVFGLNEHGPPMYFVLLIRDPDRIVKDEIKMWELIIDIYRSLMYSILPLNGEIVGELTNLEVFEYPVVGGLGEFGNRVLPIYLNTTLRSFSKLRDFVHAIEDVGRIMGNLSFNLPEKIIVNNNEVELRYISFVLADALMSASDLLNTWLNNIEETISQIFLP